MPELPAAAADFLDQLDADLRLPARDSIEIQEELTAHLEDSIASLMAEGLDEERAASEAVARLGRPEALARDLEAARRTTRRLFAGAAGGVFQAGVGALWGFFVGYLTLLLAVVVAALLLTTVAKPPVDFLAAHLPAFDTNSNDLGLNAIFVAFVLVFAAWFGARRAVRTTYQVSRRDVGQVRTAWAVVGGIGLLGFVLFVYSAQQTWLGVAAELVVPTAFVLGALKFDWKGAIHLPLWAMLSIVVLSVVLPVVLVIPLSTSGGGGGRLPEPLQTSPSPAEVAYDRVAPLWGSNTGEVLGADSGTIEQQSIFDMRYSHLNGPALNQFSNIRLEVWHGTSLPKAEAAYDPELVPDPSYGAPFLSRSLSPTADGALRIHLDLSKVRANEWVIFITATGPDGHRYRLNYPESFWSTFHGTALDWLTASD